MTSLEGVIRELFMRAKVWRRVLIGGLLSYLLLSFGYLRQLAKLSKQGGEIELPPMKADKESLRQCLSALPLGAFYWIVPLLAAAGIVHLFHLLLLDLLAPIVWGLAQICALTLTAVGLVLAEDDAERFFLGLEFEKVLAQWWKLKRYWAIPALAAYGLVATMGVVLYGFSFFIAEVMLVAYLGVTIRNLRYA